MFSLKFLHAGNQSLAAFNSHSIIAAGTETANITMALNTYHTLLCSEGHELILQILIFRLQNKGKVH